MAEKSNTDFESREAIRLLRSMHASERSPTQSSRSSSHYYGKPPLATSSQKPDDNPLSLVASEAKQQLLINLIDDDDSHNQSAEGDESLVCRNFLEEEGTTSLHLADLHHH